MSSCSNILAETVLENNEMDILFRVWSTLLQLLQDRGYTIDQKWLSLNSLESLSSQFKNPKDPDVNILHFKASNLITNNSILIFWFDEEKLGVKQLKQYMDAMDKQKIDQCLVICKYSITMFGKKALEDFNTMFPTKYMEYFEYSDLLINITKHNLVPNHVILSEQEKKDLIQKYNLKKESQLPKMHRTDPIARYYGLRKGNIVKVIRESVTDTKYVTYRIVV